MDFVQKNIELWNCMGFSHNVTDPIKDLYCCIGGYNPVKYLNLNIRKAVYNFIFLLINILICFHYIAKRDYPTPFNNTFQTFGIINDFQLANNRFGLNYFYLLIVLVFILSILINFIKRNFIICQKILIIEKIF